MNLRPVIRMLRRFPHSLPARGLSESRSRWIEFPIVFEHSSSELTLLLTCVGIPV